MNTPSQRRIIRRAELRQKAGGISDSTIDRYENAGLLPSRVQIGPRSVGWWDDEVDDHLANLPRGKLPPTPEAVAAAKSAKTKNGGAPPDAE